MLKWSVVFFLVAIVAGVMGFTDVARGASAIAQVLFCIFLGLFVLFLGLGLYLGRAVTKGLGR